MLKRVKEEFSFLHGNMLVLTVSYMLSGFASGLYYPNQSNYYMELGATAVELGLISSLFSTVSAFIRIPGSYIADKVGRRRIIIPFTFTVVLGLIIQSVAPDWRYILPVAVILGISQIYKPAIEAIEADSIPKEKRGLGYSIINMAPGVFSSISPIIGGFVVARYNLLLGRRYLCAFASFIVLCIAILRIFYLEETVEVTPVEETLGGYFWDALRSFKEALTGLSRKVKAFMLMEALYSFTGPVFSVYLSILVIQELNLTFPQWGIINSLFLPVSLLLSLPVGKLVDKVSRRISVLLGALMFAPVGYLLVHSNGFAGVALVITLMNVSQIVTFSSVHALRADIIPKETRGRIMGLLGVMKHLVAIPGALVFGWVYDNISTDLPFYVTSGIYVTISILIFVSFRD